MSDGTAQIIVTMRLTWDGDGASELPADIAAYNNAMEACQDYAEDVCAWVDGVTLVSVEATG
jgi:hypothetical protein